MSHRSSTDDRAKDLYWLPKLDRNCAAGERFLFTSEARRHRNRRAHVARPRYPVDNQLLSVERTRKRLRSRKHGSPGRQLAGDDGRGTVADEAPHSRAELAEPTRQTIGMGNVFTMGDSSSGSDDGIGR